MNYVEVWQHFVVARLGVDPLIVGGFIWNTSSVMVGRFALSWVDVIIAYAMLSLGCILNPPAASALFGEQLTLAKFVGIGIICLAVFALARI